MEQVIQLNSNAKLSEHFTLGELTKSGSHPEVYNIPSHEAIVHLVGGIAAEVQRQVCRC